MGVFISPPVLGVYRRGCDSVGPCTVVVPYPPPSREGSPYCACLVGFLFGPLVSWVQQRYVSERDFVGVLTVAVGSILWVGDRR